MEEAVQDVLVAAWAQMARYEHESDAAFRRWLAGIAMNICRRARRKRRDLLTADGLLEPGSEAATAYRRLVEQDRDALVMQAAAAILDPREQEIVAWRYVNAYPGDQIVELAGLRDRNALRVVLQRCRRRLEREIRQRLEQLGRGSSFLRSG